MSSILKALEKVEEAKNPRRSSGAGLGRGRERRAAWVIPAWALGGGAVAALVTFSLMGGFSKSASRHPEQASVPQTIVVPPLNVVPEAPASAAGKTALKTAKAAVPQAAPKAVKASSTAPAQASKSGHPAADTAAARKKQADAPERKPAQKASAKQEIVYSRTDVAASKTASSRSAVPHAAVALPAEPPQSVEKPRPAVRVTGIAWQRDGESSFAMVNGRPVRQGGVVDGYKVDQINENSVRFSGSNGTLTVPLGAAEE